MEKLTFTKFIQLFKTIPFLFLVFFGLISLIFGIFYYIQYIRIVVPIFTVVVLPHHNLTGNNIDQFYSELKKKYHSFDRIVIISPDHFGKTTHDTESVPFGLRSICYEKSCIKASPIDPYSGDSQIGNIFSSGGETHEHGIGEHIKRIHTFFPSATTTPILLRRKLTPGNVEKNIARTLAQLPDKRILIIASVDFSHHVREEIASLHDNRAIETLNTGDISDFGELEVDCRNCLAVAKYIAIEKQIPYFHLVKRTSVDALSHSGSDINNTSHIFGSFQSENSSSGAGIFLFGGDTHWARAYKEGSVKNPLYQKEVLKLLYQQYDVGNPLNTKYHRIFTGFDDVIVNWESGIAREGECPKSGKTTQMWTDPIMLPLFYQLGITLVNIANNHSHDCGEILFDQSIPEFVSSHIEPFGYERTIFRSIRGDSFAFMGIDLIEKNPDQEKIKKKIQSLTASGNIVVINIHWGKEYQATHDTRQEQFAHELIDAGVRLVIGHHPHVVQDQEIYKGVPIYYSLGNFLFDQPFPETLRGILAGCAVSRNSTTCHSIDIFRDPKRYILHF